MTLATTVATTTAPAKINLTLDIHGRRQDGFHDLRSLVIGVDLCDLVRCRPMPVPGIDLICDDPDLRGPQNLVCRAAACLAKRLNRKPALRIELDKAIPVGAGLGGGSSDAATTLRLCNALWKGELSDVQLAEIGATLGSDISLFFSLPSAIMTGRGEIVEPVSLRWRGWALLAFVETEVLTPAVYGAWQTSDASGGPVEAGILEAERAAEIMPMLSNGLEPAIFRVAPTVKHAVDEVTKAGLGPVRVSGAGATLYRLFDDKQDAAQVARRMEELGIGLRTAVVEAPVGPKVAGGEEC